MKVRTPAASLIFSGQALTYHLPAVCYSGRTRRTPGSHRQGCHRRCHCRPRHLTPRLLLLPTHLTLLSQSPHPAQGYRRHSHRRSVICHPSGAPGCRVRSVHMDWCWSARAYPRGARSRGAVEEALTRSESEGMGISQPVQGYPRYLGCWHSGCWYPRLAE